MSARRHGLLEPDEAAILEAAEALGWRLLNVSSAPRTLVFGGPDWQARFVVGSHVELSAHDPEALANALALQLPLGPPTESDPPALGPPARPRLADWVEARAHVRRGRGEVHLHDTRAGTLRVVGPDIWAVLRCADGTRDRDALRLASGSNASLAPIADLLVDGLPSRAPEPPVPAPRAERREVRPLPGFALRCDGAGGCCGAYGAVPFTAAEAAVARELGRPGLGSTPLFTPFRGSDLARLAVAQVDEACAFLDGGGRCGLHAWRGPRAKPFACRLYPTTVVDDGESLRASVAPECACVFVSARTVAPEAPLAELGDDPSLVARVLPDPVPLSPERAATRGSYRAWSDRLYAHLANEPRDLASYVMGLALAVRREGLGPLDAPALVREPLPNGIAARLREAAALPRHAAAARDVAEWAARAVDALEGWPSPTHPERERFYLRALTFGHRLATEGRSLERGLRERGLRIIVGRAMGRVDARGARSPGYPLAALEGALRHLGARLVD